MPTMTSVAAAVISVVAGLGSGAATLPLRAVSGTTYGPQSSYAMNVSTATATEYYMRCQIIITEDTTSLVGYFPNWWIAPSAGITNNGSNLNITQVSLETNGTYVPLTFSGIATAVVAPGGNMPHDEVQSTSFSLAKFAKGTTAWYRMRFSFATPASDKIPHGGSAVTATEIGRKLDPTKVNFTNGINGTGAFAYSMINGGVDGTDAIAASFVYRPIVIGRHSQPAFGCFGDSKGHGTGDTATAIGVKGFNRCLFADPAVAATGRSGINFSNPSGIAADCTTAVGGASVSSLTFYYQFLTNAICGYGTNGLDFPKQQALWAQIRAGGISKIIQFSLTPRTTVPILALTSITRVGTACTITMPDTSTIIDQQQYVIAGAVPSQYNGTFVITKVNGTTLTYTALSTPGSSPATNAPTISDNWSFTANQTPNAGWSSPGTVATFEASLLGAVSTDANLTYVQTQGERAATSGANYFIWGVNGVPSYMTPDGLHQSFTGYELSYCSNGTITTQAGGTVAGNGRSLVQSI